MSQPSGSPRIPQAFQTARRRNFLAIWLTMLCALATGCASTSKPPSAKDSAKGSAADGRLFDPIDHPLGYSTSAMSRSAVLPLGEVPYDNMVLPLVSPDGRFIATQTGVAPTWETALAEAAAQVPQATRVEIYGLDRREPIEPRERMPAALLASLSEPALLGRSCDEEGFLVESPREDGSRWIGKASWENGTITWLVTGSDVNAFAALGPDGRLAWSRRPVGAERFDLVFRQGEREIVIAGEHGDWLHPVWSGRGDLLFALNLQDGALHMCMATATSEMTFHQSVRRVLIAAAGATLHTAYQTLNGQTTMAGAGASVPAQLVFFHPASRRMAVWRPFADASERIAAMGPGSIAALVDQPGTAMVSTTSNLMRQNLKPPHAQILLVAGTQIVRPTSATSWPYILLRPGEGRVGVMAMRLLTRDEATNSAARAR